jgi:flagellar basal-body rod protein FlgB
MSGLGLPLVEQLKTKMHWLQTRQKLLAENVANSDTPKFKPRDLRPMESAEPGGVELARSSDGHMGPLDGSDGPRGKGAERFETMPSGNAVSLEDEMMKVAQTQADYQAAADLYSKSLSILKIAVGKK